MRTSWTRTTRHLAAVLLLALCVISNARATAFSVDNSDLWLTQGEDGWGVQLVQQADVMFATIYVYDQQGLPIYYTSTLNYTGTAANGDEIWVGDLYYTRGPWFGAPTFDSTLVRYRLVGQMTFASHSVEMAGLSYSVDGIVVNKNIYRYPLRYDDYSGSYVGAYKLTASRCFSAADDGTAVVAGTFNVLSQTANSLTLLTNANTGITCNYPGDYQQFGQFGQSAGSFTCSNGQSGSYTLYQMNVSQTSINGRISAVNNLGCALNGAFSAVRQ